MRRTRGRPRQPIRNGSVSSDVGTIARMRSVAVAIAVLLLAAGCGGAKSASSTTASGASGAGSGADVKCEKVDYPIAQDPVILKAPAKLLDATKTYTLTFDTTCGTLVVKLDAKLAPHTVASLVSLARRKYFDDTPFVRIVPHFVIQAGDPTQTGAGQPGYGTVDVPPRGTRYTLGTMAMAKSPLDQAGAAGSQFFIVTTKDAKLRPVYAVVGKVTKGLDVVKGIGKLGNAKQQPVMPIVIRTVTVDVSP